MSKKPRFPPSRKAGPRSIVLAIFPDLQLLDAAGPIAAFEIADRYQPGSYTLRVVSTDGGITRSSSGIGIPSEPLKGLKLTSIDTLIVIGGQGTARAMQDAALIGLLQRASGKVRRLASVCSGAFLLAQAGLLDGKRATTHWRQAPRLA